MSRRPDPSTADRRRAEQGRAIQWHLDRLDRAWNRGEASELSEAQQALYLAWVFDGDAEERLNPQNLFGHRDRKSQPAAEETP